MKTRHTKLYFILLFPIYLLFYNNLYAVTNCNEQVAGWAFDWDDNVMFMPTQVILYSKTSNETINISTHEFAIFGPSIGKEGKYKDYEVRSTAYENSFKYFSEDNTNKENYFLNDIIASINDTNEDWKGPVWDEFIYALNNEKSANWTVILTARGHSAESIYAGLEYLQSNGIIKYLPKLSNVHAVSNPKYDNYEGSTSAKKARVIKEILDQINLCNINDVKKTEVFDQDGQNKKPLHVWYFSDDDIKNIVAAKQFIGSEIAVGRWPNIKVSLLFTGKENPNNFPESIVLSSKGNSRLPLYGELLDRYILDKSAA